jgi:hypothetical protein
MIKNVTDKILTGLRQNVVKNNNLFFPYGKLEKIRSPFKQ